MILVLDNHDSFVYNVARYLREVGAGRVVVVRSDAIDVAGIRALSPSHLVVSPGPCTPREAGVSVRAVQALAGELPILGICLGHQVVAEAFGGRVVSAVRPMHGAASAILHRGEGILAGLPRPFAAGRYHSLVVDPDRVPSQLAVVARSPEGEIMALRHVARPVWGLQFHPESILTPLGHEILRRFLVLGDRERAGMGLRGDPVSAQSAAHAAAHPAPSGAPVGRVPAARR